MYRLSRLGRDLDNYRPPIRLCSRNKIKFNKKMRTLEGILKSPMNRGIKLWNMILENIQQSVTKVKWLEYKVSFLVSDWYRPIDSICDT